MDSPENIIVGWKEWVSLPDLEVPAIQAKIDTGATTSSIHAYNIKYILVKGRKYVEFDLHPIQKSKKISASCRARLLEKRTVKSSNGESETRPVIKTMLKINNFSFEIELNLTNRDSMGMRMLIGREAMKKVLVNPNHRFLHGKLTKLQIEKIYKKAKKCK